MSQSYKQNYGTKPSISINSLRTALAKGFQHRRKFLVDTPDDAIDSFFAIVNGLHSNYNVN